MNLQTARLLMPIQRRQDAEQERLAWLPEALYETRPTQDRQDRN